MDPQQLAAELSRILAFGSDEEKAQAQQILVGLEQREAREAQLYPGNRTEFGAPTPTGTLFQSLARIGQKVKSVAQGLHEAVQASDLFSDAGNTPDFLGDQVGPSIGSGLRQAAQAVANNVAPALRAASLLQEVAPPATSQATPDQLLPQVPVAPDAPPVPFQGLLAGGTPADIQATLQAQAQQEQVLAAEQAYLAQQQQVAALQAQQIGSAVDHDALQRQSELLRLTQIPTVNPAFLNNAAQFSAAPVVGTAPANLTSNLAVQQSIGQANVPSQLPVAQANINQRQRVGRIEQSVANQSIQQQERALELAREAYINDVARRIFNRRR